MTPEDVAMVQRSWAELCRQTALDAALTRQFERIGRAEVSAGAESSSSPASARAAWLLHAVADLVDLLQAPSRLADRARALAQTWPDPRIAPSFAREGRAWLAAAAECQPSWSPAVESAWRQAWLLLSDVLAAEALSPFAPDPSPPA